MSTETVGIPEAVDTTTGARHGRHAIGLEPEPFDRAHLRCGGCQAQVSAVSAAPRRTSGGGLVQVAPFFRLYPKRSHDPGCRYDWAAQTKQLVTDSSVILSNHGQVFELRLPQAGEEQTTSASTSSSGPRTGGARRQVRTNHSHSLPRLLATATAIARLLRTMDDPELAGRFRVRFGDELIAWDDFFIDLDDPDTYPDQLRHLDALAGTHPLAVAGRVREHSTTRTNSVPFLDLSQNRGVRPVDGLGWLHPRIASSTVDLDTYRDGARVLAYGHWRTYPAQWADGDRLVSLFAGHAQAITTLPD